MNTRVIAVLALLLPTVVIAQSARYPLTTTEGLRPHNVLAQPATLQRKRGLKVLETQESGQLATGVETLVLINDLEFGDGVIEAEIAGDVRPGTPEGARGFVGIAFRVLGRGSGSGRNSRPNTNPMWTSFLKRGRT